MRFKYIAGLAAIAAFVGTLGGMGFSITKTSGGFVLKTPSLHFKPTSTIFQIEDDPTPVARSPSPTPSPRWSYRESVPLKIPKGAYGTTLSLTLDRYQIQPVEFRARAGQTFKSAISVNSCLLHLDGRPGWERSLTVTLPKSGMYKVWVANQGQKRNLTLLIDIH